MRKCAIGNMDNIVEHSVRNLKVCERLLSKQTTMINKSIFRFSIVKVGRIQNPMLSNESERHIRTAHRIKSTETESISVKVKGVSNVLCQ